MFAITFGMKAPSMSIRFQIYATETTGMISRGEVTPLDLNTARTQAGIEVRDLDRWLLCHHLAEGTMFQQGWGAYTSGSGI
jgi:hypothetical protein